MASVDICNERVPCLKLLSCYRHSWYSRDIAHHDLLSTEISELCWCEDSSGPWAPDSGSQALRPVPHHRMSGQAQTLTTEERDRRGKKSGPWKCLGCCLCVGNCRLHLAAVWEFHDPRPNIVTESDHWHWLARVEYLGHHG